MCYGDAKEIKHKTTAASHKRGLLIIGMQGHLQP